MVKVTLATTLSVSSTPADEKDLANMKFSVTCGTMGEGSSRKILIPATTSDLAVGMAGISNTKLLFVKTNPLNENEAGQSITIKRNNVGAEEIEIAPVSGLKYGVLLLSTDSLSELYVTNAGSVDVEMTLVAAGD